MAGHPGDQCDPFAHPVATIRGVDGGDPHLHKVAAGPDLHFGVPSVLPPSTNQRHTAPRSLCRAESSFYDTDSFVPVSGRVRRPLRLIATQCRLSDDDQHFYTSGDELLKAIEGVGPDLNDGPGPIRPVGAVGDIGRLLVLHSVEGALPRSGRQSPGEAVLGRIGP